MESFDLLMRVYLAGCFADGVSPTVAELAARAGMSRWAFTRCFKRATGQSPGVVLCTARIREAKRLMIETDMPVQDVSRATGFSSTRSLHRAFRRRTGTTPSTYRSRRRTSVPRHARQEG